MRFVAVALFSLLIIPLEAQSFTISDSRSIAKRPAKLQTIEQLATAVATAYSDNRLDQLELPVTKKIQISIEHSLGAGSLLVRSFKTWQQGEKWLSSMSTDGRPFRESRSLSSCDKGICNYDFRAGISHNHLYLRRLTYGYKNGRPYIKSIYLLDGD